MGFTSLLLPFLGLLPQVERADGLPPVPELTVLERSVGPHLSALLRARRTGGYTRYQNEARLRSIDMDVSGTIEINVAIVGAPAAKVLAIESLGADVLSVADGMLVVRAHTAVVPAIAQVAGVENMSLPIPAVAHRLSEGVSLTGANVAHGLGADGTGTRVAVIDVGFIGLTGLITGGGLPQPVFEKNFTSSGFEATDAHGTAVAEIVHQMAPGAELILVKIGNLSQFKDAMSYVTKKKAHFVNVSLGFPGANFSDGTGVAVKAINKAHKKGVVTVVSSGNSGTRHWLGPFTDVDSDGFLEFGPGDEGLSFNAQVGESVSATLVWDKFPTTKADLDLTVFFVGSTLQLVAFSTITQKGQETPFEGVGFTAPFTGAYAVFVNRVKKDPGQVALFLSHNVSDGNNVQASSLMTPADAKKAVTVGAMSAAAWPGGPLETFSSRGPTLSGVVKPDIVGPDGTTGSLAGLNPFFGTSAAAPHVAGGLAVIHSSSTKIQTKDAVLRLGQYADVIPGTVANDAGDGAMDLLEDFFVPTPAPPAIDANNSTATSESVSLVFETLTDASPPVLFNFDFVGNKKHGGSDRDFAPSDTFVDTGLKPNRIYKYRVKAKDSATIENVTEFSADFKIRTAAKVPSALKLLATGSSSVTVRVRSGGNPSTVTFALFNETDNVYVGPDGNPVGATPVFKPLSKWSKVKVKGLSPGTAYTLKGQARNSSGILTALSVPLNVTTNP